MTKNILKQSKQILIIAVLTVSIASIYAQQKQVAPVNEKQVPRMSSQLKEFYRLTVQASASFIFPKEFKEVKAPNDEDFSFDYAMELPGKGFEIWLLVKSEKDDWNNFVKAQAQNSDVLQANPDSLYASMGSAQANAFTGERNYLVRSISPDYLTAYNADVGKSYLLTLLDLPDTKHYKYALMFTLQKFHTGTILAVCFTNDKGPEFFKNINKVKNCLKFKS
ncbi:MAG TPA: hypothetical protein VGN20_00145 [Mucilaginibacter sp.]|jgi:hypothetical protein